MLDFFGEAPLYITGFKGVLSMLTLLFSVVYISNNFFKSIDDHDKKPEHI